LGGKPLTRALLSCTQHCQLQYKIKSKEHILATDNRNFINDIYKNKPLNEIPWNNESPPELLVKLIESGKIPPCKAVDLGCGAGNYIIYLASLVFDATGINMSSAAIEIARKNAESRNIKCYFLAADVVNELDKVEQKWDFAYDWNVLHHILAAYQTSVLYADK
jgi:2-polyprenyl-3-methyl-5-hydroxy-6-metoxy-1,4-benzoquinol methylase